MIYVGIDPGAKGAWAVIAESETGTVVNVYHWDDVFFVSDMQALSRMGGNIMAAVEKVGARPGQGVISMFNFGQSYGFIQGVLRACGIGYQLVPPGTWKREFGLLNAGKQGSVDVCKKLFPGVSLMPSERCRKESDGMGDALLLCTYAQRHFGNGKAIK